MDSDFSAMEFSKTDFSGTGFPANIFSWANFSKIIFRKELFWEWFFEFGFFLLQFGCGISRGDSMKALVGQGSSGNGSGATSADGRSFWIGGTGVSSHMINDLTYIHDRTTPAPSKSRVILGDDTVKEVALVGKLDLVFHSMTDVKIAKCFLPAWI